MPKKWVAGIGHQFWSVRSVGSLSPGVGSCGIPDNLQSAGKKKKTAESI
jgi:hypothetical protein